MGFVSILVAVALLIASSTAFILWRSRIDTFRRADAASETMLLAIAKDLQRTIAFYDISLRWAINGFSTPGFAETSRPVRRQMLFASDLEAQALGGVLIVDAAGRSLYESGAETPRITSIADKPYFIALREHPDLGLVLSKPFQTVITKGPSIALARRIAAPDGRFDGVAVSTFPLSYIGQLIATAAVGTDNVITLLNTDGIILSRQPAMEGIIGRDMSSQPTWPSVRLASGGTLDTNASADRKSRHFQYIRVGDFPLVLMLGMTYSAIYANWWSEVVAIGGLTAVTIALLLGLARALYVELARRRHAELIARDSAEQFRLLADNVSDAIIRLDLDGVRHYASPAAWEVFGFTPQELLAMPVREIVLPEDWPIVADALRAFRAGTDQITITYRCLKNPGTLIWVESRIRLVRDPDTDEPCELISLTRDVTANYHSEQELRHLAVTDGLSGLANRRAFDEALETEWRRAMNSDGKVALLMVDVDYFKLYNDNYGHPAGDAVLRMIAGSIGRSIQRPGDLAARYGGEEFAVLLPRTDDTGAVQLARWICQDIAQRMEPHAGSPLRHVTISIGVACRLVMPGDDPASLIREADQALYEAKRSGRNRVMMARSMQPLPMGEIE